jgi:hypothetical protein
MGVFVDSVGIICVGLPISLIVGVPHTLVLPMVSRQASRRHSICALPVKDAWALHRLQAFRPLPLSFALWCPASCTSLFWLNVMFSPNLASFCRPDTSAPYTPVANCPYLFVASLL